MRIIELAGIGPGPFAAMMLADHGAEVVRVERDDLLGIDGDPLLRGRRSIRLDLKKERPREALIRLAESADALIDPYRPGRLEALGLGPDRLQQANPKLVIGRLTGWGQHGPLSQRAGHDINYLAMSGLLRGMGGAKGRPVPPANLVADYAGGAMMLAFAMAASLREVAAGAERGRIIDCAMSEGAALLGSFLFGMRNAGYWQDGREANLLDGGAGFYGTYRTADGGYLALGAIEPQFRAQLLDRLGLAGDERFLDPLDRSNWAEQREEIGDIVASQSLAHWIDVFEGSDSCVAPVLGMEEAPRDAHHRVRGSFVESGNGPVPAPAPRYGEAAEPFPPTTGNPGSDGAVLLKELGYDEEDIAQILGEETV